MSQYAHRTTSPAGHDGVARHEPARELRCTQQEGNGGQDGPRPEQRDDRRPDQRGRQEGDREQVGRGTHRRRGGEDRQQPERGHRLGVRPDRDGRRDDRHEERTGQADLDRDEVVQPGGGDERDRHDPEADGDEDVGELALTRLGEQPGADDEHGTAADQAEDDPRLGTDPAATEGEAQEQDRAGDQGPAADPGQDPAGQELLEATRSDPVEDRRTGRPGRPAGDRGTRPASVAVVGGPAVVAGATAADAWTAAIVGASGAVPLCALGASQ